MPTPTSLAALIVVYVLPSSATNRSLKFTPPVANPTIGIKMSLTAEPTTAPNAPPMTTPTAMSTTLPRSANALNSLNIPMIRFLRGDSGSGGGLMRACRASRLAHRADEGVRLAYRDLHVVDQFRN